VHLRARAAQAGKKDDVLVAIHRQAQERAEGQATMPGNFRAAREQQARVQLGKCRMRAARQYHQERAQRQSLTESGKLPSSQVLIQTPILPSYLPRPPRRE
jgi:hypothetical protein